MMVAVSTLDRLRSAPTERSIPAVMMTNVMPTAMIPVSDTARTILAMLSGARKRMWPCRRGDILFLAPDRHHYKADHALKANGDGEEIDPAPRRGRRRGNARGGGIIHGRHPSRSR